MSGFTLREIEDVIQQRQQVFSAVLNRGQVAVTLFGRSDSSTHDIRETQDAAQWSANFVTHVRQEFALAAFAASACSWQRN